MTSRTSDDIRILSAIPGLCELHNHLYGSLDVADLAFLAGQTRDRPPRPEIFQASFERRFGSPPVMEGLFLPENRERLESYAYYLKASDFAAFQTCFDLVISFAYTDPAELGEIAFRTLARERAEYIEYRQMFSPFISQAELKEKVHGLVEGLAAAERQLPGKTARLALSVHRPDEKTWENYRALRELMDEYELVKRYVVGLDFCAQEEGFPPSDKAEFFREVLGHNRERPEEALAILYHVGESFTDKSVESALRWVLEAARLGAHRLGHAVALGVNPEFYRGVEKSELVCERIAQINFELESADALRDAGVNLDRDALGRELSELASKDPGDSVPVVYTSERLQTLEKLQDWAMVELKKTGAVIESCPTSNLRICGLEEPRFHPLPRFLAAGLPVTLGADDPGILKTSLELEYELVGDWEGIDEAALELMRATARKSKAGILSGRPGAFA